MSSGVHDGRTAVARIFGLVCRGQEKGKDAVVCGCNSLPCPCNSLNLSRQPSASLPFRFSSPPPPPPYPFCRAMAFSKRSFLRVERFTPPLGIDEGTPSTVAVKKKRASV
jgi:hypothetical protein